MLNKCFLLFWKLQILYQLLQLQLSQHNFIKMHLKRMISKLYRCWLHYVWSVFLIVKLKQKFCKISLHASVSLISQELTFSQSFIQFCYTKLPVRFEIIWNAQTIYLECFHKNYKLAKVPLLPIL